MGNSSDGLLPKHSADIIAIDRLITTICEHIVSVESLPRGSIAVRIDKPSPDRVIVPVAEVVQARLAVIAVGHHLGAAGIDKTGDIALSVSAGIQMSTL